MSRTLEEAYYPTTNDIASAVKECMR